MLDNHRGFALTEALVSVVLVGVISMGVIGILRYQNDFQADINLKTSLAMLRDNTVVFLGNSAAWHQTVNKDSAIKCANQNQQYCKPGTTEKKLINLYDPNGKLVVNSNDATSGFTQGGAPCNSFNVKDGNDSCPFKVKVLWRAVCPYANCQQEDFVEIQFDYKPKSAKRILNLNRYNVAERSRLEVADIGSPAYDCSERSKVFIGPSQSFNGYTSDAQGCVDYAAFRGPQGERGIRGTDGAVGPKGADAVCPP